MGFWSKLKDAAKAVWSAVTPAPAPPTPPAPPPREMRPDLFKVKRARKPRKPAAWSAKEKAAARRKMKSAELNEIKEKLGLKTQRAVKALDDYQTLVQMRENKEIYIARYGKKGYKKELEAREMALGLRETPLEKKKRRRLERVQREEEMEQAKESDARPRKYKGRR